MFQYHKYKPRDLEILYSFIRKLDNLEVFARSACRDRDGCDISGSELGFFIIALLASENLSSVTFVLTSTVTGVTS